MTPVEKEAAESCGEDIENSQATDPVYNNEIDSPTIGHMAAQMSGSGILTGGLAKNTYLKQNKTLSFLINHRKELQKRLEQVNFCIKTMQSNEDAKKLVETLNDLSIR